jgi:hypothetical protein
MIGTLGFGSAEEDRSDCPGSDHSPGRLLAAIELFCDAGTKRLGGRLRGITSFDVSGIVSVAKRGCSLLQAVRRTLHRDVSLYVRPRQQGYPDRHGASLVDPCRPS